MPKATPRVVPKQTHNTGIMCPRSQGSRGRPFRGVFLISKSTYLKNQYPCRVSRSWFSKHSDMMPAHSLLYLILFSRLTLVIGDVAADIASQASNTTALHNTMAPPWVSSTNLRGSSDILKSCIATLISCVYTAIHLNVPREGAKGWWPSISQKFKWTIAAILAPEIVLYNAVSQFLEARWLRQELRKLREQGNMSDIAKDLENPPDHGEGQVWTSSSPSPRCWSS